MDQRQPGALAAHLVFLSAAAIYAAAQPPLALHVDTGDAGALLASAAPPRIVCEPVQAASGDYLQRLTRVIVRTEGAPVGLSEDHCEP